MSCVIAIAGSLLFDSHEKIKSKLKSVVEEDYIRAILQTGAVPMIIPVQESQENLKILLSRADGLLLIGGYDINPLLYDQNPSSQCGPIFPVVDSFYLSLIHAANELHLPVFGICKGAQALNIAFGGSLCQDVGLSHVQKQGRFLPCHKARLVPGTSLHALLGKETIKVNSYHHQAIDRLASNFRIMAYSEDGIIEAIEKMEGTWMMGVQWHPEMLLAGKDETSWKIFHSFINYCQNPD